MAENFKKKADQMNEEALISRDRRAVDLNYAEVNGRKRIDTETALFNKKLVGAINETLIKLLNFNDFYIRLRSKLTARMRNVNRNNKII